MKQEMKIELSHISKYYQDGERSAKGLEDVSLSFETDSSFVVVTGESGAGKSTLFHVLTGTLDFDDGEITFDGKPVSGLSDEEKARIYRENIAFDFQEYNLVEGFSAAENIVLSLTKAGFGLQEARKKADEVLDMVGLSSQKRMKVAKLSGGERQRVAIARCLASEAKVLLFDEPTGNLDPDTSKEIVDLIRKLQGGRLILFITHDFSLVKDAATRHIVMKDGKVESDTVLKTPEKAGENIERTEKHPTPKRSLLYSSSLFAFRRPFRLFITFLLLLVSAIGIYFGCYGIAELNRTMNLKSTETAGSGYGNEIAYVKRENGARDPDFTEDGENVFFDNGDLLSYFGEVCFSNEPMGLDSFTESSLSKYRYTYRISAPSPIEIDGTFYTAPGTVSGKPIDLYYYSGLSTSFKNSGEYTEIRPYLGKSFYFYPKKEMESVTASIVSKNDSYADLCSDVFANLNEQVYISHVYFTSSPKVLYDTTALMFGNAEDFRSYYQKIDEGFLKLSKQDLGAYTDNGYLVSRIFGYPSSLIVKKGEQFLKLGWIPSESVREKLAGKLALPLSAEADFDSLELRYGSYVCKGGDFGKENAVFDSNVPEGCYYDGFSRMYELRREEKTVGRIYAPGEKEARSLADSYADNASYRLDYLEAFHQETVRSGLIDLLTNLSMFAAILAAGLAAYFLFRLVQFLLGRFYYRKGADEKVLSDIGYTSKDMLEINLIQFVSVMTVSVLLTHLLLTRFIPDAAADYALYPYVFIFGILLSYAVSVYVSRPARKHRRKERHHD